MKFAYTKDDGFAAIVHASPKEQLEKKLGTLTDEQYREHVIEKSIPKNTSYIDVLDGDIPRSREFRAAWKLNNNVIYESLPDCVTIQLSRVREKRIPKMEALDIEYMMAQEKGSVIDMSEVANRKKTLRECTDLLKALKSPKSIDDIKKATPSWFYEE